MHIDQLKNVILCYLYIQQWLINAKIFKITLDCFHHMCIYQLNNVLFLKQYPAMIDKCKTIHNKIGLFREKIAWHLKKAILHFECLKEGCGLKSIFNFEAANRNDYHHSMQTPMIMCLSGVVTDNLHHR